MNITIISVGKIKEKYFTAAIDEYSKRLSRFAKLNIIEVADEKIPDNASEKEMEQIKEKEGNKILAKLPQNPSATTFITFIIGGSLGLSDTVKSKSALRLSFGKMTLPHQLIRVVLLEQIYRAFKINNNESYHK